MLNIKSIIINLALLLTIVVTIYANGNIINREHKIRPIKQNPNIIEIDLKGEDNETILYSDIFSHIKLIPLETNHKSLIGSISSLQIINDTIYILDARGSKSILLFKLDGKFISKIGRVGKGPGEYIGLSNFSVEKGIISIFDVIQQKIVNYNIEGKFISEMFLNKNNVVATRAISYGKNYLAEAKSNSYYNQKALINKINPNGNVEASWFELPKFNKGWDNRRNLGNRSFFKRNEHIIYTNYFNDTIFHIKEENAYPYIVIKSPNPITENEVKIAQKDTKRKGGIKTSLYLLNKYFGISNYLENDTFIHFTYNKGFRSTTVLHNKNTNETKVCNLNNDMEKSNLNSNFIGCTNEGFIQLFNPLGNLQKSKEQLDKTKAKLSKSDLKILNSIKIDDNPVLLHFKTK